MKVREAAFALALSTSAACATYGVSQFSKPLAWIVGGVLLGGLSWLLLAE